MTLLTTRSSPTRLVGARLNANVIPIYSMRKTLAIIVAPLMPAIIMIGVPVIVSRSWPFNDSDYKIIIAVSVLFGYLGFGVFGIPIVYWLNKIYKLNLIYLSLAGAATGSIVFSLFSVLLGLSLNSTTSINLGSILWGAGLGISVAITYGIISGITIRSKPQDFQPCSDAQKTRAV